MREHNDAVNRLDVITGRDSITVDYAPGSVQVVEQHDGTRLRSASSTRIMTCTIGWRPWHSCRSTPRRDRW